MLAFAANVQQPITSQNTFQFFSNTTSKNNNSQQISNNSNSSSQCKTYSAGKKDKNFQEDKFYEQKVMSAGLLLTDGEQILGCEKWGDGSYGQEYNFDIPKGIVEDHLTVLQTVIKETFEETGLNIESQSKNLKDLGIFSFRPTKDLYLYMLKVKKLPDITTLKCHSFFTWEKTGKEVPEMIGYKYFKINEIEQNFMRHLGKIIKQVCIEQGIGQNNNKQNQNSSQKQPKQDNMKKVENQ